MSNISTAILFTTPLSEAEEESVLQSSALLNVGGRPLLARNIIQLSRRGITRFYIIGNSNAELQNALQEAPLYEEDIRIESTLQLALENTPSLKGTSCLFLEASSLVDDRVIGELLKRHEETLQATFAEGQIIALKAPTEVTEGVTTFSELAVKLADTSHFHVDSMPLYIPNRRREVPILAERVTAESNLADLTDRVLKMGQKGTLDWPARWIHPFFENALVKLALPTSLTPNMVTVITGILGFWITYLFATGQMITATVGAMVIGILDGVDGKLARTKMLETNIGELEHLVDKVVEYSWYVAMAYYFASSHGTAVWGLALIAVCFAWAETVQGEFYRRLTGVQLDDAGKFEKYWRLIGGRRNTFIWTFLPFAALGYAYEGFWMIAIYSLITFFVAQVRFIVRFRNYANENGGKIAQNWSNTAYF